VQVGDLVKHKRTGACGLLLGLAKGQHYWDAWFEVRWFDGYTLHITSHLKDELELISESR